MRKKIHFFQVHLNQLKCFRALNRKKEAMHATNECLKRTTNDNLIYDLLRDAVGISANVQGKEQKSLTLGDSQVEVTCTE